VSVWSKTGIVKSLLAGVADLIFPPQCMNCGVLLKSSTGLPFCNACYRRIRFVRSPCCECCGLPFEAPSTEDHLCSGCISADQCFSIARSAGIYEDVLLEAVHKFKYNRNLGAGKALAKLMAEYEYPSFDPGNYDWIMPVPLHPRRLRQRGFNQAVILSRELAERFSLSLQLKVLRRSVHTRPQFNLGRTERGPNVKGAFEIGKKGALEGKKVILVDDVYTTGSTVRECAKTLLQAGAQDVAVLTLARAI
jgi:ComF family protein